MNRQKLIQQIIEKEFSLFDEVSNRGGRAYCQDDFDTFNIMRGSQFEAWSDAMLESYQEDLLTCPSGRNLLSEKYARMMEETHPEEYIEIEPFLPQLSKEQTSLISAILSIQMEMTRDMFHDYPLTCRSNRPLYPDKTYPGITSIRTYLYGELCTYSAKTLSLYYKYLVQLKITGRNLPLEIMENTSRRYGYRNLAEREAFLKKGRK